MSSTRDGASGGKAVRAVFLSSDARTDTSVIRKVLEGEGVSVLSQDDIELGQSIWETVFKGIRDADVVIAVLRDQNPNVFYELGIAHAMKKPVLIISTELPDPVKALDFIPKIRARGDDEEALRFGIRHYLRAPHHRTKPVPGDMTATTPLGDRANAFLAQLQTAKEEMLVRIVVTAIRESGVEMTATAARPADDD